MRRCGRLAVSRTFAPVIASLTAFPMIFWRRVAEPAEIVRLTFCVIGLICFSIVALARFIDLAAAVGNSSTAATSFWI